MNRRPLIFTALFVVGASLASRTVAQNYFFDNQMLPGRGADIGNQSVRGDVHVPPDEQSKVVPDENRSADLYAKPEAPNDQIIRESGGAREGMFYKVGWFDRIEPKAGGAQLTLPQNLSEASFRFRFPFEQTHGGLVTNAEIRLGRLYYDVISLSGSALYSDNVNWTESNRQGGVISIVRLNGMFYMQLRDNLQLAARLEFIYLPIRGRFGVAGFTRDTASGRLMFGDNNAQQAQKAQLTYNLDLGEWDISLYDEVRANFDSFGGSYDSAASEPFDQEDRAGRYVFGSNVNGLGPNQTRVNELANDNLFIYSRNQVGVAASRMLPTETRMTVGAYRMDYLYNSAGENVLPNDREVGFVTLENKHNSMRFKPFASYEISRNGEQKWDQEVHTGLRGPVTENITFVGSVGYFIGGQTGRKRFLAQARLEHTIGPYTSHSIEYRRDVTAPVQDLEESYCYQLHQVLGPYLTANPFVSYSTFEDLSNNGSGTREWRAGLLFASGISSGTGVTGNSSSPGNSSKTSFRFGPYYKRVQYTASPLTWERWVALAEVSHFFTETVQVRLDYQYQDRRSNQAGDSFYENLFMVTITKYFDAPQHKVAGTDE